MALGMMKAVFALRMSTMSANAITCYYYVGRYYYYSTIFNTFYWYHYYCSTIYNLVVVISIIIITLQSSIKSTKPANARSPGGY